MSRTIDRKGRGNKEVSKEIRDFLTEKLDFEGEQRFWKRKQDCEKGNRELENCKERFWAFTVWGTGDEFWEEQGRFWVEKYTTTSWAKFSRKLLKQWDNMQFFAKNKPHNFTIMFFFKISILWNIFDNNSRIQNENMRFCSKIYWRGALLWCLQRFSR